jgi:hypothetical protein
MRPGSPNRSLIARAAIVSVLLLAGSAIVHGNGPNGPAEAGWAGDYLAWPQMRPLGDRRGTFPAVIALRADPDLRLMPERSASRHMFPIKEHVEPQPYALLGDHGEAGARVETLRFEIGCSSAKSEQPFDYYCEKRDDDGRVWPVEWFPAGALDAWERACREDDPVSNGCLLEVRLNPAAMLPIARKLVVEFPERLTTRYWLVASLCLNGEIGEARTLVEQWRADFENDPTWRGDHYLAMMEMDLKAVEPKNDDLLFEYDDYWFGLKSFWFPGASEEEWFDWVAAQAWVAPPYDFSMGDPARSWEVGMADTAGIESWIPQLVAICARRMALGERERSRRFLLGFYSASKRRAVWQTDSDLWLSDASERIAIAVATPILLHSSWSAAELASIWNEFSAEIASEPRASVAAGKRPFWPPAPDFPLPALDGEDDSSDYYLRLEVARALFLEALRVRHYRAVTGEWPRSGAEGFLTGLFLSPETLYSNPYRPGEPIRSAVAPEGMYLWAPEPGDAVRPTPAEIARRLEPRFGQSCVFLPTEAAYDFPREPGHVYANRAEWDRRYPLGLGWKTRDQSREVEPGPFAAAE